jgi:hypothetical protein
MPEQVRATLFPVKTSFGQLRAIPDSPQILVNKRADQASGCKKAAFWTLLARLTCILRLVALANWHKDHDGYWGFV